MLLCKQQMPTRRNCWAPSIFRQRVTRYRVSAAELPTCGNALATGYRSQQKATKNWQKVLASGALITSGHPTCCRMEEIPLELHSTPSGPKYSALLPCGNLPLSLQTAEQQESVVSSFEGGCSRDFISEIKNVLLLSVGLQHAVQRREKKFNSSYRIAVHDVHA